MEESESKGMETGKSFNSCLIDRSTLATNKLHVARLTLGPTYNSNLTMRILMQEGEIFVF